MRTRPLLAFWLLLAGGWSVTAHADRVTLRSGDVLIGRVVSEDKTTVTLEHPMLGKLTLRREAIKALEHGASTAGRPLSIEKRTVRATRPPGDKKTASDAARRTFLADWDLSVSLGLAADDRSGTDTLNFTTRFLAKRADEQTRDKFQYLAFVSSREGTKSREDMHAQLQHDWLDLPSPWFTYGQADYDHDDFKHFEHRLSALGGIGYDPTLGGAAGPAFRAGLGMTGERGGFEPSEDASLFGGEVSWQLDPRNKIQFTAQAAPVFEDAVTGRRLLTTADWTTQLTQTLSFQLGMRNDRDTRVPAHVEKDDRRLFGSIVIKF